MGFGEWLSGAGSAVDRFLGGTGGEPISQGSVSSTDEYAAATAAEMQPISANVEPAIPANQSIVTNSRDETGEYRVLDTDTKAPAHQASDTSYIAYDKPQEILERADYTKISDIGDSKTQELIKEGYSPEQATAMQRDEKIAELMSKGYSREQAAESKDARYYQVEYDKARENKIGLSSEYHHEALESGLPQNPNPFEYAGDIAKMDIYKSQGVSNVPGTGLLPTYRGSLLEMANLSTKAERSGEMGDYKYLGRPFSSSEGILSLARQQDIGESAATSKFNPEPWSVDRSAMARFTPELKQSSGFNLFYREAKLGGEKTDIANRAIKAADVVGRGATFDEGAVIKSPGITAGTINDYLLPEDRVSVVPAAKEISTGVVGAKTMAKGFDIIPDVSRDIGLPAVSVTGASRKVEMVEAPTSNWVNRYSGGRVGGDESLGGLKLYKTAENPAGLLYPLKTPKGSAMDRGDFGITVAGVSYRKAKKSKPTLKRKTVELPKPDPKILDISSLSDKMLNKSLGSDLFKFKVGSPDKVFKSDSAHEYVKATVKFDIDKIGITKAKSMGKKIKLPEAKVSAKAKNISGNINDVVNDITKAIKSVKTK